MATNFAATFGFKGGGAELQNSQHLDLGQVYPDGHISGKCSRKSARFSVHSQKTACLSKNTF